MVRRIMAVAKSHAPQEERCNMDQPAVLIVSDDADFSRAVAGCWKGSGAAPVFTMMSGDLCRELDADAFDVAVMGSVRPPVVAAAHKELGMTRKPILVVLEKDQRPSAESQECGGR